MTRSSTYLTKNLLLALAAGLALSCGGDGGGPPVDSQLLGIYRVTNYQGSTVGCEQPSDLDAAPFVVLYGFVPNDDPDEARLGGLFCGSVDLCRRAARDAPEPQIGYSFIEGNDVAGWRGWAIESAGPENDRCRADVQAHVLTSASMDAIHIETKTFATVFDGLEPDPGSTELTCRNIDALAALRDDPPCTEILVLDATFEAGN